VIVTRYIAREIYRPFLTVVAILLVVFAIYGTAVVLNDAAAGLAAPRTVSQLVLIKVLIGLEVLLPVALYVGAVVGLGRLHASGEIVALAYCGISELAVLATVVRLAVIVAGVAACLSLLVRPWAYEQQYYLRAVAEAEFDVEDMEPGRLFVSPDSDYAVYAASVDRQARAASTVLVQIRSERALLIIQADELRQSELERERWAPREFVFLRGESYRFDRTGSQDVSSRFQRLTLRLEPPDAPSVGYKSKMQSTAALSRSAGRKDLAEYQWRLSTPLATVLLAMLAVPISRARPRQGQGGRLVVAILAFAAFFSLVSMAKNLVQEGMVGRVPGLWWPLVLLALVLLVLLAWPRIPRGWRLRWPASCR
jgi:lipopolysaccharide export system permease protein